MCIPPRPLPKGTVAYAFYKIYICSTAKSIDCFIEDQAFSQSYDLAPPPTLCPVVSSTGDTEQD